MTLSITADMVLNFCLTAQFQSFSKILYCRRLLNKMLLNPLTPNSDQYQFSPDNIHILSREMFIRID